MGAAVQAQELVATVKALLRLKRAEEVLRRRAEELLEADRRKDEFLAMLAHELRNPLAAIRTSQADRRSAPAAATRERAAPRGVIERQVRHLTRLVDDLLDVSRVTRGKIVLERSVVDIDDAASAGDHGWRKDTILRPRNQSLTASLPPRQSRWRGD